MNPPSDYTDRRSFSKMLAGAVVAAAWLPGNRSSAEPVIVKRKLFSSMGTSGSLDKAAFYKEQGAEFLTVSTGDFLVPDKSDEAFGKNLVLLSASPLPVLACNGFIRPPHLRCVGAEANHDQILEWAETAFRRLKQAKGKFIVFGSGGARELRNDWPKQKADAQFVTLLKRMGPLAKKHDITVVVEQLREKECNYINHIGEGAELIRKAAHPHIRLLADLYHMASMGDTPSDLKAAMDVVVHVEIAEKDDRTLPGIRGDDFRPYFRILRDAGYQGAISIEGKGSDSQYAAAFNEIAKQAEL